MRVFLTKQTVDGVFALVYGIYLLLYDKLKFQKIDWKAIMRKIAGALCLIIPFVTYLIVTDSFIAFLDLCFGGIIDFGSKNHTGSIFVWQTGLILCVSFFCFLWFKEKKDTICLLLALFSITSIVITIPLANSYHINIAIMIALIGLINSLNIVFENLKSAKVKLYLSVFSYIVSLLIFMLVIIFGYDLIYDFEPTNVSEKYKNYYGMNVSEEECKKLDEVNEYIRKKEQEGYNVYIMSPYASVFMIPLERNNYKYDLLLQGNLGYQGEERLVEEIKTLENPLFLKTEELIFQESVIIDDFIKENYKEIDKVSNFIVYAEK